MEYSLLGVASLVFQEMNGNDTISGLWDRVKSDQRVRTFDRFVDALTLLFAANLIDAKNGILRRVS
jgi:hypothetical protein